MEPTGGLETWRNELQWNEDGDDEGSFAAHLSSRSTTTVGVLALSLMIRYASLVV
jgi:hypothetical protein